MSRPQPLHWRGLFPFSVLFLLSVTTFVCFIYHLRHNPKRTPFVVVSTHVYDFPYPPHAWTLEDLDRLKYLDNHTISFYQPGVGVPADKSTKVDILNAVKAGSKFCQEHAAATDTLIFYISAHGFGDGRTPFLLPPAANPLDPDTWLELRVVLETLCTKLPDKRKLVVLDCQRFQTDWQLGFLQNSFAASVKQLYERGGFPNLAILCSANVGQRGQASADLTGSVFAHFFRLGIAGDADRQAVTGNQDHEVVLSELEQYLISRVDPWAAQNRGSRQQPLVLWDGEDDFVLARSLNPPALRELLKQDASLSRGATTINDRVMNKLWRQHDELRRDQPYRHEPLAWRDLERRMLWLEQLSGSGRAYQRAAREVFADLKSRMDSAILRTADALNNRSIERAGSLLSGDRLHSMPTLLPVHSLPMSELFGRLNPEVTERARNSLAELKDDTNGEALRRVMEQMNEPAALQELVEHRFLEMVFRYQSPWLWENVESLRAVLELRELAESRAVPRTASGLPGDERAHYWARPFASAGDVHRRFAEDLLFANNWAALAQQARAASGYYGECERVMNDVTDAYALRDSVWAQLVYYACWFSRLEPATAVEMEAPEAALDQTLLVAAETQDLAKLLADIEDPVNVTRRLSSATPHTEQKLTRIIQRARTKVKDIAQKKNKLEDAMAKLTARLNDHVAEFLFGGTIDEPERVSEIEHLLLIPLLSWEQRRDLRHEYTRLSAELHGSFLYDASIESPPLQQPVRVPDNNLAIAERILGRLFSSRKVEDNRASDEMVAGVEETLADELADGQTRIHRQILQLTLADLNEIPPKENQYQHWGELDDRLRAVAPFWFPDPAVNPVARLRKIGLHHLFVWHSTRVMNDFWGPDFWGPPGNSKQFFNVAANNYLENATRFASNRTEWTSADSSRTDLLNASYAPLFSLRSSEQPLISQLDSGRVPMAFRQELASVKRPLSVNARVEVATQGGRWRIEDKDNDLFVQRNQDSLDVFASDWVVIDNVRPILLEEGDSVTANVGLSPRGIGLPQGTATLRVVSHRDHTPLDGARFSPSSFSAFGPNARFKAKITPDGIQLADRFQTQAIFRGHESFGDIRIQTLGGTSNLVTPHRYGAAQLRLHALLPDVSIIFVLDCSESMRPHLPAAKEVLTKTLERLARFRNVRVGMFLFGHRVGWSKSSPPELKRQTSYIGDIPFTLAPERDVERILALGEHDLARIAEIQQRIDSVLAWGQSPLYLALANAEAAFNRGDSQSSKHVIAITDGRDYQFGKSAATASDVVRAWEVSKVPIHLIDMSGNGSNSTNATAFSTLQTLTGGKYQLLRGPTDLEVVIQELLFPGTYTVQTTSRTESLSPTNIGEPFEQTTMSIVPESYIVSYESAKGKVLLEAGDNVDLYVSQNGSSIYAYPYDTNEVRRSRLVLSDGLTPSDHFVRLHHPLLEGRDAIFELSVQQEASSRPLLFAVPSVDNITLAQLDDGQIPTRIMSGFANSNSPLSKKATVTAITTAESWQIQDQGARYVATKENGRLSVSLEAWNPSTPHPPEVWVEITPIDGEKRGETYFFFDANYEPNRPVPVLRLVARKWPIWSRQAEIRLWLNEETTSPLSERSLNSVITRLEDSGRPFVERPQVGALSVALRGLRIDPQKDVLLFSVPISADDGLNSGHLPTFVRNGFKANGIELSDTSFSTAQSDGRYQIVDENRQYSARVVGGSLNIYSDYVLRVAVVQAAGSDPLRVDIAGGEIVPQVIRRRIDVSRGVALHYFHFSSAQLQHIKATQGSRLRFFARSDIQEPSRRLNEQSLTINLSQPGELLSVSADKPRETSQ